MDDYRIARGRLKPEARKVVPVIIVTARAWPIGPHALPGKPRYA
jgi:hypothetical protein